MDDDVAGSANVSQSMARIIVLARRHSHAGSAQREGSGVQCENLHGHRAATLVAASSVPLTVAQLRPRCARVFRDRCYIPTIGAACDIVCAETIVTLPMKQRIEDVAFALESST